MQRRRHWRESPAKHERCAGTELHAPYNRARSLSPLASADMSLDPLIITVGLIGVVIVVAALLSGVIERTGLPQVAVFLVIGAALGPAGIGLLKLDLNDAPLRVCAT